MTEQIFIQALGFIALVCFVGAFQFKSTRTLFILQGIANTLFAIQYFLLGGLPGAIGMILNTVRNLILLKYHDWDWVRRIGWVILFILFYGVLTYFTWIGPVSLVPLAAFIASTIGNWTNNARTLRIANLVCGCPGWLIFDIYVGSIGGVVNESLALASIIISIWRYGWKALGEEHEKQHGK